MALSHSLPDHRFPADAPRERRALTFAPPREPLTAAPSHPQETAPSRRARRSRVEQSGIFVLVAAAHVAAAVGFARFQPRPAEPPQPPITVSLITPPAVVPAPVPPPEPPAPQPEVRREPPPKPVVKPRPPKPVVKAKTPKPTPKPEPVSQAPTAVHRDPPPPVELPSEPAAPVAVAPPAAPPPAPAPAPAAVTAARFDAAYLNNPPPPYPPLSRRMREEGKVMLRVFVTAEGTAGKIELAGSSGSSRLDAAAEKAVARWRFVPAKQDGRSVEAWVVVPIVFKLEG